MPDTAEEFGCRVRPGVFSLPPGVAGSGDAVTFEEFFQKATGCEPYGYQERIARDGLPAVVEAPTGAGKTGLVLAWLWRLLHLDQEGTPRRLVYALPQRSLADQVVEVVQGWLTQLGLAERVSLHVVMGGHGESQRQWRLDMHRPAIVVGTVDSLVSKALNRGYGIARATYPIDFSLVTNGAHWLIDEVQLCPESTTTMRQIAAFAAGYGTAEPFGLTCMTATVPRQVLETVDNPHLPAGEMVGVADEDRRGVLGTRLAATRTVRRLPAEAGDWPAVAAAVRGRHRPGTLTLVVVNTVRAARALYDVIQAGGAVECTLLHSRFRANDRRRLMEEITAEELGESGRIVVATQVIEAGIDISAPVMITEAAVWPSVVQRAGRCNRGNEFTDAELWWLPPVKHHPYHAGDVAATVDALTGLEGVAVTGEELQRRPVPFTLPDVTVLRRRDLLELWDTAPDLSGSDIDISPYVRDADDSDAQLAWALWEPLGGPPPTGARVPEARWRCRAPVSEVNQLLKRGAAAWRRDQGSGQWAQVLRSQPVRPGEVLVVASRDGGYSPRTGLDVMSKTSVPDCPQLPTTVDRSAGGEDGYGEDAAGDRPRTWLTIDRHADETRQHARALLDAIRPALPDAVRDAVTLAAYAHDAGKCHKIWQDALLALATPPPGAEGSGTEPGERPAWAKSDVQGQLRFAGGVPFRHELVSMLLLGGPLAGLLDGTADPDLVRYLVLAHHGKLRVQVREPADRSTASGAETLLGLTHGETVEMPTMLGQGPGTLVVDLDQFAFGSSRSWTRMALGLRDRYGLFVLAYLETLVRIADWRSSAGLPEAGR